MNVVSTEMYTQSFGERYENTPQRERLLVLLEELVFDGTLLIIPMLTEMSPV